MSEETASVEETGNVATAESQAEAVTQETATTTSTDWKASLPDDIRESASLAKFDTIEGLAKSYVNAEKMIGADKIVIPKEGDADGYKAVMTKLGLPESAEGYGFTAPESVPEGLQYSAEVDGKLATILHKNAIPKSAASGLRDDLIALVAEGGLTSVEQTKAAEEAAAQAAQEADAALKKDWGEAYEQRAKIAGMSINRNFSAESVAAMEAAGLGNNPAILKDMYALGVRNQGEKELLGEAEMLDSPADLDAKIAKFESENMAALTDVSHVGHAQAVKERNALYEKRWAQ